jgi:hypothetical protein
MFKKLSLLMFILTTALLASCNNDPWVAKIDGKPITLNEFEEYYYANHSMLYGKKTHEEIDKLAADPGALQQNPFLKRDNALKDLIRQKLMMKVIAEDKEFNKDPDFKALAELSRISIVVNKYSEKKFTGEIDVTPAEVQAEYEAHKDEYANAPANQVESYIKQKLQYQKVQDLNDKLVDDLKSSHKVVKNDEVLDAFAAGKEAKDSETVLTIDGKEKMTLGDYKVFYYAQNRLLYDKTNEELDKMSVDPAETARNPLLNKKEFFETLLTQKLLYKEAMEGDFKMKDDAEIQQILKMQDTVLAIDYYIKKKFKKELEPTDQEIEAVYQQYKQQFAGKPANEVYAYIKPRILQQKLQQKGTELVEKERENSSIEYNYKTLNGKK